MTLRAPFPWFGGKRRCAHLVWERFGDTPNYVEPFAGSLAVLLGRPHEPRAETVNDLDCYVANFWRALAADPEAVAAHADWPVNEADLHARHQWLVDQQAWRERIKTDAEYFDVKVAGWWAWGISQWIGSGWCVNPEWRGRTNAGNKARGIHCKRPRLARGERGVTRKMPRIDRGSTGVDCRNIGRQLPCLHGDSGATGRGVHASALEDSHGSLLDWFEQLADRLRRVRVCCGDWSRTLGPSPTTCIGMTAVFLDPPYSADRATVYSEESFTVAHQVREWAIAHGDDPLLRIALCGYEGEHEMPANWSVVAWKAHGGYGLNGDGTRRDNRDRERIWFSPHCLGPAPQGVQQTIEMGA
jgi:hypothetical protein